MITYISNDDAQPTLKPHVCKMSLIMSVLFDPATNTLHLAASTCRKGGTPILLRCGVLSANATEKNKRGFVRYFMGLIGPTLGLLRFGDAGVVRDWAMRRCVYFSAYFDMALKADQSITRTFDYVV